jgi:hypothetical protein
VIFSGYLSVASESVGAITGALNGSGWLEDEVIAAGQLRQGKAPSRLGMVTGTALVEVVRPRRSKFLPRHFVLALTTERIVAFKAVAGGGSGDGEGPYMLRIKPGECGCWPRASMRLVDLTDGPQSTEGTLELDGLERVVVSRPNLDGDPDTDDLFDLLSGGVQSTRLLSPQQLRAREDEQDLRQARSVRSGEDAELAADAARGRPEVELTGWAERRGLRFRGGAPQAGHLSVTCPWSTDLLFNVVRGHWPGGTEGVLCHEVRLYELDQPGALRGGALAGAGDGWRGFLRDAVIPLAVGGVSYQKVPYTSAGARTPHVGTVSGLHIARRGERHMRADDNGIWREQPLEDLGLDGHWIAAIRKHSDEHSVRRLLEGPVRDLLATPRGLGFEIRVEYGQAIVSRQDFLSRDEDLDSLVGAAETLAQAVSEICGRAGEQRALDTALPAPEWLPAARRQPGQRITSWPIGARLDMVLQVADARGLEVEDPRTFHGAFPALNVPGQAFGVLRGQLPGTTLSGRMLCCAERPMALPDDFRKLLSDPGGIVGCDVAVLGVDPFSPETPAEGEPEDGMRVAVANGVLTAWRTRTSWQADGAALDQLAADLPAIMTRRGIAALR